MPQPPRRPVADSSAPPEAAAPRDGAAPAAAPDSGWGACLGIALLIAAALALRLNGLGRESLWFDEVNTLWRAAGGGLLGVLARAASDVQAPLYDLLVWALTALTGRTDSWFVRLPSALTGAALVPVAAALTRETALTLRWPPGRCRRAGLLAALIVAVAPFLVRYGQEARPYALLALLAGLVLLGALRAVASGGRRGLLLLAVGAPLLVLTNYYGVLLLAAAVAFLLLDAGAFGARLPRVVLALLPALLVLLLWSPAAVRQFTRHELGGVYRPLDGPALLEILDAQGLHAALAAPTPALDAQLGAFAAARPWALWGGRGALLAVVGAGAVAVWRRRGDAGDAGPSRDAQPSLPPPALQPAGSCRAPALILSGLGVLAAGAALLVPGPTLERVAAAALKGGRALDAENLAFLESVRLLGLVAGAVLLGLAALVAALPALARRAGCGRHPGRLLVLALLVPPLLVVSLDLSGTHTLATRNMIVLAPAAAALSALGLLALPRVALSALAVLLVAAGALSLLALPAYSAKADWRGAGAVISDSAAEPVCYPPWLARCVEYHAHRPWNSVFGSWSVAAIEAWAGSRERVVLVEAHEAQMAAREAAAVRAALAARFGEPVVQRLRGVTCRVYAQR